MTSSDNEIWRFVWIGQVRTPWPTIRAIAAAARDRDGHTVSMWRQHWRLECSSAPALCFFSASLPSPRAPYSVWHAALSQLADEHTRRGTKNSRQTTRGSGSCPIFKSGINDCRDTARYNEVLNGPTSGTPHTCDVHERRIYFSKIRYLQHVALS